MNKYENHLNGKDMFFITAISISFLVTFLIITFNDFKIQKEYGYIPIEINQEIIKIDKCKEDK